MQTNFEQMRHVLDLLGIEYEVKPWLKDGKTLGRMLGIPTYIIFYFDNNGDYKGKIGF